MKNTGADNENNAIVVDTFHFNDTLTQPKGGHSLLEESHQQQHQSKCDLKLNEDIPPVSSPMGHKGRFYSRVFSKTNVTQESRSQSLPNSLDNNKQNKLTNGNEDVTDCCDTHIKLLPENESPPQSPIQELWFNTWPERNEKTNNKCIDEEQQLQQQAQQRSSNPPSPSKVCDNNEHFRSEQTNKSVNNILTLNEALNSISLAYSPVTKQLHYIQKEDVVEEVVKQDVAAATIETETTKTKLGHRRTEAGSFSSTVSSLSDPSPSGSLLDAEDRTPSPCAENGAKSKKKGLTSFFSRNVFSWRSTPVAAPPTWNLFNKTEAELEGSPIHESIVASSSALIQHERPSHLPAKDSEEEQRHRDEYKAMLAAAKRREAKNSFAKHKQQKHQLQVEDQLASAAKYWNTYVLPKWDSMQKTKKTREMWWQGLPSSVRGKIWRLAIGNDLNLTQQLYEICSSRAQNRLNSLDSKSNSSGDSTCSGQDTVDQESSLDVIKLDIARTFPNLCIFQEGGPYSSILHSLLAAYVCYRPDVGYVQGMSFIGAVLILNMELFDAFICFANLLNRPLHLAAYTLNQKQMQAYYAAYNEIFSYNLPKLFAHFENSGLTPDLYLLDWVYTVFAKAMPLDVACRVWDVFLRDGDEFIFRTALGVLHLHQDILLNMDFLHGAQFLTRLPDDLSAENLFRSIQTMYVSIGKQTFSQIVDKCKENL